MLNSKDQVIVLKPIIFNPDGQQEYTITKTIQFYTMPACEESPQLSCWMIRAVCEIEGQTLMTAEFIHLDRFFPKKGFTDKSFEEDLDMLILMSLIERWSIEFRKPIRATPAKDAEEMRLIFPE